MSNFHTLSEGREGSILIPKAAVYWFKDTSAKGDGDVVAISHLIEVSTDGTSLTSIPLSYSDKEPTDRKIHSLLKTADKNGSNRVNAEWQSAFQEVLQTDSSGLPGLGYQLFNTSYAEQLSNGKFIKKNMLIARPDEDGNTIEPLSTIYPGDKIFCHGIDVRPCLNLRADLEGRSRWTLSLDMGMPAPSDHDSALSKSDYSKVRGYVEEFKTERSGSYSPTAIDKLLLEYTTGEAKFSKMLSILGEEYVAFKDYIKVNRIPADSSITRAESYFSTDGNDFSTRGIAVPRAESALATILARKPKDTEGSRDVIQSPLDES